MGICSAVLSVSSLWRGSAVSLCNLVWCGVVWCGAVRCGVVNCGVVCRLWGRLAVGMRAAPLVAVWSSHPLKYC